MPHVYVLRYLVQASTVPSSLAPLHRIQWILLKVTLNKNIDIKPDLWEIFCPGASK